MPQPAFTEFRKANESQNKFQIFYFLNFNLHHAERFLWYRYKPRQCKLWGQKKGCFDLEEPGKVLINVACEPDKSSSSSQSVGSTNSVLGFSTYSLVSLLQVGLSLAISCHRLYINESKHMKIKKMKIIKRTKNWLSQEERKEERKKERNCQRGRLRKKWINKLMVEDMNERKSEWIWNIKTQWTKWMLERLEG